MRDQAETEGCAIPIAARQRRDAACCLDCLFQTGVTHGATDFSPSPVPLDRAYNLELILFQFKIDSIGLAYVGKNFLSKQSVLPCHDVAPMLRCNEVAGLRLPARLSSGPIRGTLKNLTLVRLRRPNSRSGSADSAPVLARFGVRLDGSAPLVSHRRGQQPPLRWVRRRFAAAHDLRDQPRDIDAGAEFAASPAHRPACSSHRRIRARD